VIKNDTLRTLNHKDTIRVCRLHLLCLFQYAD